MEFRSVRKTLSEAPRRRKGDQSQRADALDSGRYKALVRIIDDANARFATRDEPSPDEQHALLLKVKQWVRSLASLKRENEDFFLTTLWKDTGLAEVVEEQFNRLVVYATRLPYETPGRTDLILRASAFLALIGDKSLKGGQAGSTQSAAYEASFVGVRTALHAVLREAAAPVAAPAPAAAAAAAAAPPSPDAVLVRGGRGEDGEGDRDPATSSSGLKRKRMLGAILDEHAPASPAQAQPEAPEATSPADASSACTNSELAEIFASPVPPHPTAAPVVETQPEAEAEASGVSEDVGARWSLVFGSPLRGAEAEAEAEAETEAEATSETQLSGK